MNKTFITILLFGSISINAHSDSLKEIKGKPRAIDGKTLVINGQKLQLFGIDAPEFDQMCQKKETHQPFQCGVISAHKLKRMVDHVPEVSCTEKGHTSTGVLLVSCYDGRIDISEQIILKGWAIVDENASVKKYKRIEQFVKFDTVNEVIWQADFIKPWEWRKGKRLPTPPAHFKVDKMTRSNAE
jgi:endonuclease YncB( thermonuclease family)